MGFSKFCQVLTFTALFATPIPAAHASNSKPAYAFDDFPVASTEEIARAEASSDKILTAVTVDNIRELIYPANGMEHVFIEVCELQEPECQTERKILATAAVKYQNGSLLNDAGKANDVFYFLDPSNLSVLEKLKAECASAGDKLEPPGPPGFSLCLELNEVDPILYDHTFIYYKTDGPYTGNGLRQNGAPIKAESLKYMLWNIRQWSTD